MAKPRRFLIVEARFYTELADALAAGAMKALDDAGVTYDRISVPGALEIPAAIAMASQRRDAEPYDGYVALGCVIRGETYHFEIVCNESARGIMDLTTAEMLAIGNGILTVENGEQAWERADPARKDKGGDAARAALAMAELAHQYGLTADDAE
ncbi:MAG: 6,7-dimethyl-8-ribityllumazine synthase [Alphaproteobacteria bacterium]|jgi:6,7-dimethyl-8-ribityllumazine synthase|nr:6,7-dimethyl-8-ribityllumazine synthase [Alphaproteobacteria bacterium]